MATLSATQNGDSGSTITIFCSRPKCGPSERSGAGRADLAARGLCEEHSACSARRHALLVDVMACLASLLMERCTWAVSGVRCAAGRCAALRGELAAAAVRGMTGLDRASSSGCDLRLCVVHPAEERHDRVEAHDLIMSVCWRCRRSPLRSLRPTQAPGASGRDAYSALARQNGCPDGSVSTVHLSPPGWNSDLPPPMSRPRCTASATSSTCRHR